MKLVVPSISFLFIGPNNLLSNDTTLLSPKTKYSSSPNIIAS